jgi:hypothetical protein
LIVQRVDERLVWGEQIERSYDRNSPELKFTPANVLHPNIWQE